MPGEPTVYVIEQDSAARELIEGLLRSAAMHAESFASTSEFLERAGPARPCCVLLASRLPGTTGSELQKHLASLDVPPPVIVVTDQDEFSTAVEAMRNGAIGFLEKPVQPETLLDCVEFAVKCDAAAQSNSELPVISRGTSSPIIVNSVGITSANRPPSRSA